MLKQIANKAPTGTTRYNIGVKRKRCPLNFSEGLLVKLTESATARGMTRSRFVAEILSRELGVSNNE